MKANYKVFEYCKECERPLSGIQRKFCSVEHGCNYRARKSRDTKGLITLERLKTDALSINHLKLNSSKRAYKKAKQLLK